LVDEAPEAFNAHDLESFVGFHVESAVHYQPTERARIKSEVRNLNEISHVSRATNKTNLSRTMFKISFIRKMKVLN